MNTTIRSESLNHEIDRFRAYLADNPREPMKLHVFDRAERMRYEATSTIGLWLSVTVSSIASDPARTVQERLDAIVDAQQQYEAAAVEVRAMFTAWLGTGGARVKG